MMLACEPHRVWLSLSTFFFFFFFSSPSSGCRNEPARFGLQLFTRFSPLLVRGSNRRQRGLECRSKLGFRENLENLGYLSPFRTRRRRLLQKVGVPRLELLGIKAAPGGVGGVRFRRRRGACVFLPIKHARHKICVGHGGIPQYVHHRVFDHFTCTGF